MARTSTNLIKKNIISKPYLLTMDEVNSIGQNLNVVGYDNQLDLGSDDSIINLIYGNSSSPKLLNYVEPYEIDGVKKTLFYSEVNSGFNVGDKVFIINGTYDSNELVKINKYARGVDGYKVLYIDRCRVVLDIDYTGFLPTNENSTNADIYDKYIKIYYVKDEKDLLLVNRQVSGQFNTPTEQDKKFKKMSNNFIYVDRGYSPGLPTQEGIWNLNTTNNTWENVTSIILSPNYNSIINGNSNNKLIIINGSFERNGTNFDEDKVYEFNNTTTIKKWEVTIKHENKNVPIITKSNLRGGYFNGKWNGGCYGSNEKRIKWNRNNSIWNSGTLLNVQWKWGYMNSLYSQLESYIAELDKNDKPYQRSTNTDNDGYGYNFVINSELENYIINNGNLSNSILGTSATFSIVEDHIKGIIDDNYIALNFTQSLVNKSVFENCSIINSNIENSIVKNSRTLNSRFLNVKSLNSHFKSSVFKNSNYISDNTIKILDIKQGDILFGSGLFTYYKLYINKRSYDKFKFKDIFYIKGLQIKESKEIVDFFDRKFKIGVWSDYIDSYSQGNSFIKKEIELSAFLSTPLENSNWLLNPREDYSIDIFLKTDEFPLITDIDFSKAFIQSSDFESGIFENSNWNSGSHINFNFDNNFSKKEDFNKSPIYDITLNPDMSLNINTLGKFKETELDYFNVGDIVFLNNLNYDTRGTVTGLSIGNGGQGYSDGIKVLSSSTGGYLKVDITTNSIGGVVLGTSSTTGSIVLADPLNFSGGFNNGQIYDAVGGSGTGLKLMMIDNNNGDVFVYDCGIGYSVNDGVVITDTGTVLYTILEVTNGSIVSVNILEPGVGFKPFDSLDVVDILGLGAKLIVNGTSGLINTLPDTYKIINGDTNQLILKNLTGNINITESNGIFTTVDSFNRYNYLHKVKFFRSKIVSGLFRRSYFNNCLIKNNNYDSTDKDFTNLSKIKELVITDTIFKGSDNILSDAVYYNSFFVSRSLGDNRRNDTWLGGIAYNSVWNGLEFKGGVIKESTWLDGIFTDGIFYNSRSFDNNPLPYALRYNNNRVASYYMAGTVDKVNNIYNNRYSWQKGTFNNGEFYKSDWEYGTFNDGKFYYSKFYSGIINGGLIGDKSISDTYIYKADIFYTTVENANVYSNNTLLENDITWYDGIFNSGIFGSDIEGNSTWLDGIFNGGQFKEKSKWKNGIFNDGRFTSTYGYYRYSTTTNITINDYSWEDGIFNGGEFGNGSIDSNSTWFNGEFNDGIFKGKEWNNGVFLYGEFSGSGKLAYGGMTSSNAKEFVSSYQNKEYYGLWKNGFFTDIKDKFIDKEQSTTIRRATDSNISKRSIIKDALWLSGTFSHPGGDVLNSVWLDGTFDNGTFIKSSFNPFVNRGNKDSFNLSDTCIWKNGRFIDGDFYISKWLDGNFISGTGIGMLWENGLSNYMNAYNVQWKDGIWKNGNWNGSFFNIPEDGKILDDYTKTILIRGMSASGTASCHVWSVFYEDDVSDINNSSFSNGDELLTNSTGGDTPPTAPTIFNA